ncbi:MAG: hypothetical protein Q4Q07_07670 [Tissierellia bacterium]|nr:hypothetical protein [Tissierellia bacterium]
MKKIVLDINPEGTFSLSCEAYALYAKKQGIGPIYFYTRDFGDGIKKVRDPECWKKLKSRIITLVDLGDHVAKIPFIKGIRCPSIDEDYGEDKILIEVVEELGEAASWKNSNLQVVLVKA